MTTVAAAANPFHLPITHLSCRPRTLPHRTDVAAAAAAPLAVLEAEIVALQLPMVVQHALLAMGSSIAVACVDGPSPAGKIAGVLIAAGAITILAANWHVVGPKWDQITKAFQKAFDAAAATIAQALNDIKIKASKKSAEGDTKIPDVKYPGNDPTVSPGEGWKWRGPADKGSWYNPTTGETLHPDVDHPAPEGPHWDYVPYKNGPQYRVYPDGTVVPK